MEGGITINACHRIARSYHAVEESATLDAERAEDVNGKWLPIVAGVFVLSGLAVRAEDEGVLLVEPGEFDILVADPKRVLEVGE